jgi:hypothetical protein
MSKKQIPIDIMSATALCDHVIANMGLDVNPRMGIAGIKAKMAQAGFPTEFIEIDDGLEDAPIQRVDPPRTRHVEGKRSVQLRIEPQEKPGGNEPVFTSVNGVNILIPRATTCWVDYKYYHALQNAVAHIPEIDQDSNITSWRKVPEYPVSAFVIEPPLTKEEKKRGEEIEAEKQKLAQERAEAEREDAA